MNTENKLKKSTPDIIVFVLYFLLFLSGFSALIYEVIWVRMLGLLLGVTVYATSLVLASFMLGMAMGSIAIGRFIDKNRLSPLPAFAVLEFLIALSSLLVSLFIKYLTYRLTVLSPATLYPVALVCMIIPVFFMGGTLPVICKVIVRKPSETGKKLGTLYGFNTAGGVLGCFLAGFIFIRSIGVSNTLLIAVLLNCLSGLIAFAISKLMLIKISPPSSESGTLSPNAPLPEESPTRPSILTLMLVSYSISGFCLLGYEILWSRALSFSIARNTYAFTLMLSTFLLSLAFGSMFIGRIITKIKRPLLWFGAFQILIGLSVCAGMLFLWQLSFHIDTLWQLLGKSWTAAMSARFLGLAVFIFPPAFLSGGLFPIVNRLCAKSLNILGRRVGTVYATNTIGAVFGSLLTGFLLLPFLGVMKSMFVLVAINCTVGLIIFAHSRSKRLIWVGVIAVFLLVPLGIINLGQNALPFATSRMIKADRDTLLYYNEGVTASVALIKRASGNRLLNVNGVYTASTEIADMAVHYFLGYLPAIFHDKPATGLVIGLGLGVTSASLLNLDMTVECVELAREEIGSARLLADVNRNLLDNPRFNLIIDDGRQYLKKTQKKYDLITSNAVHVSLSPYLYTMEYYELCKQRMSDRGVMCQWLPTNSLPEKEFKALIHAFTDVFSDATVWYINPAHYLLVGANNPLQINKNSLYQLFINRKSREDLVTSDFYSPYEVLLRFLTNGTSLRKFASVSPPHTDNYPYAEFVRTLDVFMPSEFSKIPVSRQTSVAPLIKGITRTEQNLIRMYERAKQSIFSGELNAWHLKDIEAIGSFKNALKYMPSSKRLLTMHKKLVDPLKSDLISRIKKQQAQGEACEAINTCRQILVLDSCDATVYNSMGINFRNLRILDSATYYYRKALTFDSTNIEARCNLGTVYGEKGNWEAAIDEFNVALSIDTTIAETYYGLGYCYMMMKRKREASLAFERAIHFGISHPYRSEIDRIMVSDSALQ